jgi:hypothetical protein
MNNKISQLFYAGVISSSTLLVGCFDGGADTPKAATPPAEAPQAAAKSGVILDSLVQGLSYSATPSGKSGITGADGRFNYSVGDTLSFTLGNLSIADFTPPADQGTLVTLADIAVDDAQAVQIGRVLQTLDADGDATNGINLVGDFSGASDIDFSNESVVTTSLQDLANFLDAAGEIRTIVSTEDAQQHIETSLANAQTVTLTWTESTTNPEPALIEGDEVVVVKDTSATDEEIETALAGSGPLAVVFRDNPAFSADPFFGSLAKPLAERACVTGTEYTFFNVFEVVGDEKRYYDGTYDYCTGVFEQGDPVGTWSVSEQVITLEPTDIDEQFDTVTYTLTQDASEAAVVLFEAEDDNGSKIAVLGDLVSFTQPDFEPPVIETTQLILNESQSVAYDDILQAFAPFEFTVLDATKAYQLSVTNNDEQVLVAFYTDTDVDSNPIFPASIEPNNTSITAAVPLTDLNGDPLSSVFIRAYAFEENEAVFPASFDVIITEVTAP